MDKQVSILLTRDKLASMGPSERVELKVKGIKRLEFDKAALELALIKPCHRFSKAIDTLIRFFQ